MESCRSGQIRDRGIPIALGVDEAICNDAVDMWNVIKTTGLIHNVSGVDSDQWPTAFEVLQALWEGGASAMLRATDLGEVAAGKLADLVLLDLHSSAFTPLNDIPGQLVYCESGRSVVLTMVDGAIVAEGGVVTTVDEAALLAETRELYAARRSVAAGGEADALLPVYQAVVRKAAAVDIGFSRWIGGH